MTLVRLETLEDERLDAYARLTEVQLRSRIEPKKGIFIAESMKVICRALDAGHVIQSILMDEKWLDKSSSLLSRIDTDIPIFVLPTEEIRHLTGFELTRGILATFSRPVLSDVEEVTKGARRIAILEGSVDHTNVGAIFRSAAALNVDAVLITPTCCDPLYRRAVRVSMGTIFQIPWTRIGSTVDDWPSDGLELLRSLGFVTAAFSLDKDAINLDSPELLGHEKLAMVFGSEGDGLARQTIAECDYTVKIPMRKGVDSLNVAAASAVAFWQLCR